MTRRPASRHAAARRLLTALLRRLRWVGIRVDPFLIVREGEDTPTVPSPGSTFTSHFLVPDDLDDLMALSADSSAEELRRRFADGHLCYGVWDGPRLVARMWCDLEMLNFPPVARPLDVDEAYLYAAYADPGYRGNNLAPFMRAACYAALRQQGRTRFVSYTDYSNAAARRFKAKLGARDEALCVHVNLWGLWSTTATVKRYAPDAESG